MPVMGLLYLYLYLKEYRACLLKDKEVVEYSKNTQNSICYGKLYWNG
jgi:hypothetical protein